MSEYVVHFTKPSAVRSAYDVMISILSEGVQTAVGEHERNHAFWQ